MSKFEDNTKLIHRAGNLDDVTELHGDSNQLFKWASKWEMNFNIDKWSVMHIGHNHRQGIYNMSSQQLSTTAGSRGIITKYFKWQKPSDKSCKRPTGYLGSLLL